MSNQARVLHMENAGAQPHGAKLTVALAGNPNCGKTTMFNALTGARQHVGNWPGVTVEKKIGTAHFGGDHFEVVDLPGTYSLTAYSQEEVVARNYLVEERPQVVVDVLNADALERHLYLAVQFLELGLPLVLALNMMDEVRRSGKEIDTALLSQLTGCPAVETVARSGTGSRALMEACRALDDRRKGQWEPLRLSYGPDLDPVLDEMECLIKEQGLFAGKLPFRWTALKYLEGDSQIVALGRAAAPALSDKLEALTAKVARHLQSTLDALPDAIIADYRYGWIAGIMRQTVRRPGLDAQRLSISDKMDRVLTHKLAGPLIMVGVIYLIYSITFTLGEIPMGWLEGLFGWLNETVSAALPDGLLRSLIVSGVIDGVGGVMGFVPLILIMFLLISALEDSGYIARMAYMLDRVFRIFGLHGTSVLPLIVSGGIAGGCAVPGVMATRTLRSPKEKLATLLVSPFMTCGAKIPVFLMLAAAFFPESEANVMFAITLGAWAAALLVARLLRSTIIKGEATPFVMELPPYRIPTLRGVLIHSLERTWQYIRKAGTVILAISVLLWAGMTFPQLPEEAAAPFQERIAAAEQRVEEARTAGAPEEDVAALEEELNTASAEEAEAALEYTVGGRLGHALEPLSSLAGFNWRVNIALVGGFAAKEVVVSTLGTAYSLGEVDAEDAAPLSEKLAADESFPVSAAVALMAFTLLYAPCFVTVVAMARESSWKWAGFSMAFNTVLAFAVAVVIFQGARIFS
jgi:ferrous iron transport protein B